MHKLVAAVIGILVVGMVGCGHRSRAVSLTTWQESIVEYVREEGNGDPNVLRNVTLPSAHRGFSIIGNDRIDLSTDASGVLLGRRQVGAKTWFIYLVGLVESGELTDIRLAALMADGVRFNWVLGNPDTQALQSYQQFRTETWKKAAPAAEKPPAIYRVFPLAEDRFRLDIEGPRVIATHEQSSTRWSMLLGS